MPPYERWSSLERKFIWRQGQHLTIVGLIGSGKTTLAKLLLQRRQFVIMLATKRLDPIYTELEQEGYKIVTTVADLEAAVAELEEGEPGRFIFKPPLSSPSKQAIRDQTEQFQQVLLYIYNSGNWAVFCDEIRYLTENLGLRSEFEVLWLQGRTLGISVVALTQRPVAIPLLAFDQAYYMFIFRVNHKDDIDRIADYSGQFGPQVEFTLPRLAPHDFLLIDLLHDRLVVSNAKT